MELTKDFHKRSHVIDGIDFYLIEASYRWWLPNPWFFRMWLETWDDITDHRDLSFVEVESDSKMGYRECLRKVQIKYYHQKHNKYVKNKK